MSNESNRRMPPEGMPAQAPEPGRSAFRKPSQAAPSVPPQRKLTDEAPEKQPSVLRKFLWRVLSVVLIVLALALCYLLLLMGEPDEEAKNAVIPEEAVITMPMSPLEAPGASNADHLAYTFGESVLSLSEGLTMQKARVYDTALGGSYARRATLTYAFEDGALLTLESLRPTAAVTLLRLNGATLDATSLYTLGGLNAARMDSADQVCIFTQTDTAVYAVLCPQTHADRLESILKYTTLTLPGES